MLGRPCRPGVHADDQRGWLGAVVAPWDIEQVLSLLARGDDCAVGPVEDADGHYSYQSQRYGQADGDQHCADEDLPDLHGRP